MRTPTETRPARQTMLGFGFAFGAALSYSISQVLTRHSVSDLSTPLVGALLALWWGTLGFGLIAVRAHWSPAANFRRGALLFAGSGIFSALGIIFSFIAFQKGEVVLVSPVLATHSLTTLLFAAIFLRGLERITPRVVVGALLVVSGVVVLSVA
jgi:drug/metabolite transporter, DME family